jgi:biotin carboxylase
MSNLGPHFIAFISRTEEKKDYIELDRNAEFVFASLSSCDPEVVTVDPKCLKDAIAKFSILHAAKPFTAILNRKEKCVVPAAQLALALDLPPITLKPELARDKHQMRQALNSGSPFPHTFLIRTTCDLEQIPDAMYPCVLKPRYGFNSRSAVLVNDRIQLYSVYEEQHKLYSVLEKQDRTNSDFVVESFIPGAEHTVESLVRDGVPLFHIISDKLLMEAPYFVEIGDTMPSRLSGTGQRACIAATERALDRMAIRNGWTHTEIKISDLGAVVIECAARMGGGYFETLYREVYGIDRLRVLASLFSSRDSIPMPVARTHATARRVVVYGPARMRIVKNAETLFHDKRVKLLWPASVSAINRKLAGPPINFNNTLFEFVALGSTSDEAEMVADCLLERVNVRSLHC